MADIESICARLCLLTRAAWNADLPAPLTRGTVDKMIKLGALQGLALKRVDGIDEQIYTRAEALLARSAAIFLEVEKQRAAGYEAMIPQDQDWPVNLYALGQNMPQFLFVRGNRNLLMRRSIAVAGSREITFNTASIAKKLGRMIAEEHYTMISGGAWGVDTAAQTSCLEAGGNLILVPAVPISRLLRQSYLLHALNDNRVLVVCDTWPAEQFSPGKALERNHTIYALGDAAVVAASRKEVGGSWNGAMHCLRGGYTPLYTVRSEGHDFDGNRALIELGAAQLDMSQPLGVQLFSQGA